MSRRKDITPRGKLCYAYASKGHYIKSTVDEWAFTLARVKLLFDPDGVTSRAANEKNEVMYDVSLKREGFKRYHCDREICFSFNVKSVQKFIKPVKKKESIILFIERNDPGKLWIVIVPQNIDKLNPRIEQYHVNIQMEDPRSIPPAVGNTVVFDDEDGKYEAVVYKHPLVIASSEFQKIKKLTSTNKLLKVNICERTNYIEFCCDEGDMSSSAITLGDSNDEDADLSLADMLAEDDTNDTPDLRSDTLYSSEDEGEHSDFGEYSCDEFYYREFDTDEEDDVNFDFDRRKHKQDEDVDDNMYSVEFNSKTFIITSKLSSLSQQTQFYVPKITYYPLKIQINIGEMGVMQIFIKDNESLLLEGVDDD